MTERTSPRTKKPYQKTEPQYPVIPSCPEFDPSSRQCTLAVKLLEQLPMVIKVNTQINTACPFFREGISRQDLCDKNPAAQRMQVMKS